MADTPDILRKIMHRKAEEVADFLVREVNRVEDQQTEQSSNMSKLTILMLAALNIANEHMELIRNHSKFLDDVSNRTANLIQKLDNSEQSMITSI